MNSKKSKKSKKHLIVLSNGLWGQSHHFESLQFELEERLKFSNDGHYVIHASTSNQLFDTYHGIDICGDRLKDELDDLVRTKYPGDLEAVSFISHSMGGLIARNAVHKMHDESSRQLIIGGFRVQPMHYCSLATPHVGFSTENRKGEETVPLARWLPFGRKLAPFVSSAMLGDAGEQFFHRDHSKIIMKMAGDEYLKSLASFKTRTCYGNITGDHLVGWGNSSLRSPDELKETRLCIDNATTKENRKHRGVVREDDLRLASTPFGDELKLQQKVSSQQEALENLKRLGWRRIDVSFRDARWLPWLAHQHIMVQRKRINQVGRDTVRHVAEQIYLMETELENP